MNAPILKIRRLRASAPPVPAYQTEHAAGLDLMADLDAPIELQPGDRHAVPSGFAIEIPPGFEGQVRPRSGRALKEGLGMPNSPGTIDADYRGEVKVLLVNLGKRPIVIKHGDRIAQLIIAPVARAEIVEVDELAPSGRGVNGFGSTGR
ncbi:MAG TPA: dUTP diphosphatase [Candidatus Binataceae bacterium]|nr:dUTP diphosphatase [Candidatus Binataceae bacterium]